MTRLDRARESLGRAEAAANDPILRSLWLAKAVDEAIGGPTVLVGGTAVNLYTGSYRPTDIDLCALLDVADRRRLAELGFIHLQGDHFRFEFGDGETWLVEFPDTQVDGEVNLLELSDIDYLAVITPESLIVDRLLQATDGTRVTFDEAVRLLVAVFEAVDWAWVEDEVARREDAAPGLDLVQAYVGVKQAARAVIKAGGE